LPVTDVGRAIEIYVDACGIQTVATNAQAARRELVERGMAATEAVTLALGVFHSSGDEFDR